MKSILQWTALLFAGVTSFSTFADAFASVPNVKPKYTTSTLNSNQLISFQEPTTNVTVKLVGSMHYNPYSIKVVENTISDLAKDGKLGSVIIESCDIRWKTSSEMNPLLLKLLQSEMGAASDMATSLGRPVILGDQRINITVDRMGAAFRETLFDVVRPDQGGWQRIWSNITSAWVETSAPSQGENYLGLAAFLDPKLLIQAPVSFFKYPLSYFVKSPIATTALLTLILVSDGYSDATLVPLDQMTMVDFSSSLIVSALEVVFFTRILTKELLAERNEILAKSILEQCRIYQHEQGPKLSFGNFFDWFGGFKQGETSEEIRYVATNNTAGMKSMPGEKTVVAVLGMAHCNGIAKLLKEQRMT